MSKQAVLLNDAARQSLCSSCPAWTLASDGLEREWRFHSFVEAFGFMTQVALLAERANHHPEFHNQDRQVTIRWATHSCGGITALDLEMAKICDQLAVDSGLKA